MLPIRKSCNEWSLFRFQMSLTFILILEFSDCFKSTFIIKPSWNKKWTQNMIAPVGCNSLPGLQKPVFPGLCNWQSHENLQCLVVLSTSTSSIFVSPYLAHRTIFITPADQHASPWGIVVIHDYWSVLPTLHIRQGRM